MDDTVTEQLKAVATRWMVEGWQEGNARMVDALHTPDFVDHDPAGRDPGREGFKEGIAQLYAAFPDFYAVAEDLLVNAAVGRVAIRWTATGTHKGSFPGIPPTGRQIAFQRIEIIRVEGGLIVERWGEWNGLDLLEQLGGLSQM